MTILQPMPLASVIDGRMKVFAGDFHIGFATFACRRPAAKPRRRADSAHRLDLIGILPMNFDTIFDMKVMPSARVEVPIRIGGRGHAALER
jgi:hypothetical protein